MWADNETEIDLLGFDFLVDSLLVALTEPRLLPLTVGVLGDWGSGKSSLLRLVRDALPTASVDEQGTPMAHYVCIDFSPWQFEHYDDVKVALMAAVLDRLREEAPTAEMKAKVSRLQRFVGRLRRAGRAGAVGALQALPATLPGIAAAVDPAIDPSLVAIAQQALGSVIADATSGAGADGQPVADDAEPIDVVTFRRELDKLIAGLESVLAVVVFVDDLDRIAQEIPVGDDPAGAPPPEEALRRDAGSLRAVGDLHRVGGAVQAIEILDIQPAPEGQGSQPQALHRLKKAFQVADDGHKQRAQQAASQRSAAVGSLPRLFQRSTHGR